MEGGGWKELYLELVFTEEGEVEEVHSKVGHAEVGVGVVHEHGIEGQGGLRGNRREYAIAPWVGVVDADDERVALGVCILDAVHGVV